MNNGVTLGQFLDLIDKTRSSEEEVIQIMSEGVVVCKAFICWKDWKYLEHRFIGCIQADGTDVISVWLKPEHDCYHCKYYEEHSGFCLYGKDLGNEFKIDDLKGCDFWEEK
jgi:hypothetical protein